MDKCTFHYHHLNPLIDDLSKETNKKIVLLGDFNIDLLNFDTSEHVSTFLNDLASNSLQPQVILPTRISKNSKNLIHNIFCNIPNPLGQKCNAWKHLIKYITSSSPILYITHTPSKKSTKNKEIFKNKTWIKRNSKYN